MIKAQAQQKVTVKPSMPSSRRSALHVDITSYHSVHLETFTIARILPAAGNEDQCLAFFFQNYVVNNKKFHPSISMVGNEHLFASIRALSTAGLSKYHSDISLSHSASHQYVKALSLTNTALSNTQSAVRDETLLAILILTNYETLTGGSNRSLEAWVQHINGATTLLRLRGVEGIKHTDVRVLTMHVIAFVNITCLLNDIPTPPFIYELQSKIFEYLYEPESPAARYQHVSLRFADFNHAFQHHLFSDPDEIIARALTLEAEMIAALVDMPTFWQAEVIQPAVVQNTKAVEGGVPDFEVRYTDQGTSYIWNSFYSSRILLREAVLKTAQEAESGNTNGSKYVELKNQSRSIMRDCQKHILASIPPFMRSQTCSGFLLPGKRTQETIKSDGLLHRPCRATKIARTDRELVPEAFVCELPVMHALGGYGFLWPLLVAGHCSTATPEILEYVRKMYQVLGKEMKIEQALVLRDVLDSIII